MKKSPEKQVDITNKALSEIARQSLAMDYSRNDMLDALAMTYSRRIGKTELMRRLVDTGTTSNTTVGTTLNVGMLREAMELLNNAPECEDNELWGGMDSYRREYEERAREEQAYRQFASMARVEVEHRDDWIILHCMDQHYRVDRRHWDDAEGYGINHLMRHAKETLLRACWARHGMAGLEPIRNGRAPVWDAFREHVTMNGMGGSAERPSVLEIYQERKGLVSECGRFRAESLYTNQRLWDESEAMRNCVYRSYRGKVEKGDYALYHIDAPHLGKRSGFTVGLKSETREERCQDRDCLVVQKRWVVDQIKGKANSTCPDRELQNFCDWIAREMGVETREERKVKRESWWGSVTRRNGVVDISGW